MLILFASNGWNEDFFSIENNMQLAHTDGKYFRFRYKYLTLLFGVSDDDDKCSNLAKIDELFW
jgi:hypothetical protein